MTPEVLYADDALVLAPLSGYTDLPYRRAARRCGAIYCFTEMIDVSSLAYAHDKSFRMLERGEDETFLGCQLVGSDLEHLKKAVTAVNERGNFDVLDLNLGCPVPKVAKKHAGAALGRTPDKAIAVFALMARLSRFPVTAKLRILDAEDPAPTVALARGLEDAGAQALTVHGRVMSAFYSGPVSHAVIRAVAETVAIPVIANGGIVDLESYRAVWDNTGLGRAMLARGAMGNPWLFSQLADPGRYRPPTVEEFTAGVVRHIAETAAYYGGETGYKIARKILLDYLKGRGYGGELKQRCSFLNSAADLAEIEAKLLRGPAATTAGARRLSAG